VFGFVSEFRKNSDIGDSKGFLASAIDTAIESSKGEDIINGITPKSLVEARKVLVGIRAMCIKKDDIESADAALRALDKNISDFEK